jgi:tRNA dimethylallyltransferase
VTGSPPLLVIAGATATGKTGLAIETARRLRDEGIAAEIISADSRQVFRGLDIGTAKVPPAERAGIPHHGLDLVDPDAAFSVADFVRHVRGVLADIDQRGGMAILAGGSGLYLRAIARGLDPEALPSDPDLRRQIDATIEADGLDASVKRLQSIAPERARQLDLRNPRRVSRALELAALVGDGPLPAPRPYPGPIAWVGLGVEPEAHARWIANRAREQFDAGLVEEARALRERWDPTLTAFSAIGYREAWDLIDGRTTRDEAIAADAARNVAFAKRQRTWFRREPAIEWLDPTAPTTADRAMAVARGLGGAAAAPAAR